MRKVTIVLSVAVVILGIIAAVVWLSPVGDGSDGHSYGISEGLQLVREGNGNLIVKDDKGVTLFPIPLRGCDIDDQYHGGKLRFREKATGRQGYIDRFGVVNFYDNGIPTPRQTEIKGKEYNAENSLQDNQQTTNNVSAQPAQSRQASTRANTIPQVSLRAMARSNPFYGEAAKILQGKLDENDASHRHVILNYCEHFRTAYTTKDIDFLRQVFSDDALIIVGNVVKSKGSDNSAGGDSRVTYALHTKRDYLQRLSQVFNANKSINVRFSDFHIMRHPTRDGIYGVTLHQHYKSDHYEDDGYLFLLWDFRNPSMPVIHVRTWQPAKSVGSKDDVIDLSDFNLE